MRLSRGTRNGIYFVLIALSLTMVYPFVYIIFNAFKDNTEYLQNPNGPPHSWTLQTMVSAVQQSNLVQGALNSALVVSVSVICVAVLSCMAGFALAKLLFAGHRLIF